eukprot:TRINITY_DN1229_c0_g1_i1.p2 TRINITY_DN1229_c0_g1~~TRINITY_DN1229_c0_g1_i1.p2  ORF type:complete len:231 (-),score=10.51 TRINITY_DN1229_c0_g1_i1:985-1677(-)
MRQLYTYLAAPQVCSSTLPLFNVSAPQVQLLQVHLKFAAHQTLSPLLLVIVLADPDFISTLSTKHVWDAQPTMFGTQPTTHVSVLLTFLLIKQIIIVDVNLPHSSTIHQINVLYAQQIIFSIQSIIHVSAQLLSFMSMDLTSVLSAMLLQSGILILLAALHVLLDSSSILIPSHATVLPQLLTSMPSTTVLPVMLLLLLIPTSEDASTVLLDSSSTLPISDATALLVLLT